MDPFSSAPAADVVHVTRVKAAVRERFGLADDVVVTVAQLVCSEPGCPPIETAIGVLHSVPPSELYKIHKPIAEIVDSDIAAL